MPAPVAGIVLCGGGSRRMGRPKWSLPFGDETMLERVVRTVSEAATPIVIAAGPFFDDIHDVSFEPSVSVVQDAVEDFGPIGGLAAGLTKLGEAGFDGRVFVTGCDYPLLSSALIQDLISKLGDEQALVPADDEHRYPLAALYKMDVLDHLNAMIAASDHRLLNLLERCETRTIPTQQLRAVDPDLNSLRNANRPEDYQQLLKIAGF